MSPSLLRRIQLHKLTSVPLNRSMTDAERRELLYFSTGSPVHPHDFGGRRLTVHVKSDTNDLPSAQVRFPRD